jgi:hypothetical protein
VDAAGTGVDAPVAASSVSLRWPRVVGFAVLMFFVQIAVGVGTLMLLESGSLGSIGQDQALRWSVSISALVVYAIYLRPIRGWRVAHAAALFGLLQALHFAMMLLDRYVSGGYEISAIRIPWRFVGVHALIVLAALGLTWRRAPRPVD